MTWHGVCRVSQMSVASMYCTAQIILRLDLEPGDDALVEFHKCRSLFDPDHCHSDFAKQASEAGVRVW